MKASLKTYASCRGLTLLEMVLVLGILGVVAGLITFSITPSTMTFSGIGNNETAAHIATRATMRSIQGSIVGNETGPGYWSDMNKNFNLFPLSLVDLFVSPKVTYPYYGANNLLYYTDSQASVTNLWRYTPKTGLGWRGPYLEAYGKYIYGTSAESRYFSNNFQIPSLASYPCPIDGWGNPIVLWPGTAPNSSTDPKLLNACLISAGPNGILDSNSPLGKANLTDYQAFVTARSFPLGNTSRYCQDDVIVFLFQPALP